MSSPTQKKLEALDVDKQGAKNFIKSWAKSLQGERVLVLFSGPMGAGKTQSVRWVLEELGAQDMASPTYAIIHQYETSKGPIDHVDLYRLEDDQDLESTGFWDLFQRPKGIVFIEWADRLAEKDYPKNWARWSVEISFSKAQPVNSDFRNISIRRLLP